ncbi:MAG: hypothetical protein ABEJ08_04790 [Halobacteriaceae archaeon]
MDVTCRGVSTAVDVVLALLMISAAVAVLVTGAVPPDRPSPDPGPAVVVVGGATAAVESPPAVRRPPNATVGGLLADAVLASLGPDSGRYLTAVRERVNQTLDAVQRPVHLVAYWRPFTAASGVQVTAGRPPPPETDVSAVVLTVPLDPRPGGVPAPDPAGDFEAVADAYARRVVARRRATCRARARCSVRDVGPVAATIEGRLRAQYPTAAAAARAHSGDAVRIVVRTWSR